MTVIFVVAFALALISAFICHLVAKQKNANAIFWGVMGLMFGPLAIPFVIAVKDKSSEI